MSKPNKSNHHDYSKFDNMSTEALEDILRSDSQLPSDEDSDMDAILYIMEVIAKREKENPTGKFSDVHTAWTSFKENYLPYTQDNESIYDYADTDKHGGVTQTPFKKSSHQRRKLRMIRAAGIAATLAALLLAGTVTASALGFDLWGAVAKWTKDTFGFSSSVPHETISDGLDPSEQTNLDSLQKALDYYEVTEQLAPTWFPNGYILENVEIIETPIRTTINTIYTDTDDEISITIILLSRPLTSTFEKDGEEVTVYTVDGIEYYIMTNLERTNVVWRTGNYECSFSGSLSVNQAKKMIDSIYERK